MAQTHERLTSERLAEIRAAYTFDMEKFDDPQPVILAELDDINALLAEVDRLRAALAAAEAREAALRHLALLVEMNWHFMQFPEP